MLQNGQTQFKNLTAFGARFSKCAWPFWTRMHQRFKERLIIFGYILGRFEKLTASLLIIGNKFSNNLLDVNLSQSSHFLNRNRAKKVYQDMLPTMFWKGTVRFLWVWLSCGRFLGFYKKTFGIFHLGYWVHLQIVL